MAPLTDNDGPAAVALLGSLVVLPGAVLYCAHRWGFTSCSRLGARLVVAAFDDPRTAIMFGCAVGAVAAHALQVIYDEAVRGAVPVLPNHP